MIYRIWNKTFTGYRFIDVWGVSPEVLSALPGVEMLLDNICWRSISIMFKIGFQKSITERLVSLGAAEYVSVPKSS